MSWHGGLVPQKKFSCSSTSKSVMSSRTSSTWRAQDQAGGQARAQHIHVSKHQRGRKLAGGKLFGLGGQTEANDLSLRAIPERDAAPDRSQEALRADAAGSRRRQDRASTNATKRRRVHTPFIAAYNAACANIPPLADYHRWNEARARHGAPPVPDDDGSAL